MDISKKNMSLRRNNIVQNKEKIIRGPNNLIFTNYKDKCEKESNVIKELKLDEPKNTKIIFFNSNLINEREEIESLIREDNVEELKKKYSGIREKNGEYLHYAAEHNAVKIGEYLIREAKFNLNKMNEENFTPLHIASIEGNLKFVKMLVENEVEINKLDENFYLNSLYLAIKYENYDVALFLIKNNAQLYEKDADGNWDFCDNRLILNLRTGKKEKSKSLIHYINKAKEPE